MVYSESSTLLLFGVLFWYSHVDRWNNLRVTSSVETQPIPLSCQIMRESNVPRTSGKTIDDIHHGSPAITDVNSV
jgi:hypothetical protein